ncbi:MAG TPA: HAMP domain-containing sensor histidine kinase [Chitinophaga sp.]|uniref:sensor histidine kinase n=1 Tax=Chitinophaga sp. TaxID=1869181 RepID=UPI002C792CB4|nr:HAMP domain-containing sensor histidine kinase [Chitinophaga sp.]HVI44606.1 HAMP domain-containing sensor histidine kinase [Chitinophaga sp.]
MQLNMKIRDRLSLQFTLMFSVVLLVLLVSIYLLVEHNRKKSFYDKLEDRATTTAQFYLAEDNLSEENFSKVLRNYPRSLARESIRIYNDRYQPAFIREDSVKWNKEVIRRVITEKHIHFEENELQVAGLYYEDNSGNFSVIAAAYDMNGLEHMKELRWIMLLGYGCSLLITYLLGRIFARIALSPISRIISNVRIIRASSLDKRLHINKGKRDEITELSTTINNLLEHLEQSFEAQRSFIANASHELRTPISSIIGEAEITLMQDRQTQEYKTTLHNVIEDATRLNAIINSLLELVQANIDSNELQPVRLDELLWEAADEWGNKGAIGKVTLHYHAFNNPQKVTIQGNRYLLFIALGNIIKNAIKFSGKKEVHCELDVTTDNIIITVRDQGIGIPQSDLHKIFQPFYRSANAITYTGFGIGLSLAEKIVRLHNGKIEVSSVLGQGTEFRLLFPV